MAMLVVKYSPPQYMCQSYDGGLDIYIILGLIGNTTESAYHVII